MNKRRKIVIASPQEPCGATWLINCFLELGILTYRSSVQRMWREVGGKHFLEPRENILKKWLPSLYYREQYDFRPDIEVEWGHEWPVSRFANDTIIFFYRDPRDGLYSRYKRESSHMCFGEYLDFLDFNTLLDKVETNYLFTSYWKEHPQFRLFRFEDYKNDPKATLLSVLEYIGITASDREIDSALQASTAEKAREVEELYSLQLSEEERQGEKLQIVNQGGIVGRWQELTGIDREAVSRISRLNNALLQEFGYSSDQSGHNLVPERYINHLLNYSDISKELNVVPAVTAPSNIEEITDLEQRIVKFAINLTNDALNDQSNYYERANLLYKLSLYVYNKDRQAFDKIKKIAHGYISISELYYFIFRRTFDWEALVRVGLPTLTRKAIIALKSRFCGNYA